MHLWFPSIAVGFHGWAVWNLPFYLRTIPCSMTRMKKLRVVRRQRRVVKRDALNFHMIVFSHGLRTAGPPCHPTFLNSTLLVFCSVVFDAHPVFSGILASASSYHLRSRSFQLQSSPALRKVTLNDTRVATPQFQQRTSNALRPPTQFSLGAAMLKR